MPKTPHETDAERVEHCRQLRDEVLGLGEADLDYLFNPFAAWTTKPQRHDDRAGRLPSNEGSASR